MREIKYNEAINEALKICMKRDKSVIVMGLGVDDPKRIFGTTNDLEKISKFKRMFDMPTAENSNTGIAIGLAISGIKEVLNYNRDHTIEESLNYTALWNAAMNFSDDMIEAFKSKTEKRGPDFQGLVKKGKYLED